MFDRLRHLFTARADRARDAEIDRLTTCLAAAEAAHANTLTERAPSADILDKLDTANRLAADRGRRIEWLELEATRLRNRITALEAQPADLPADARELRRQLWLTEQARTSLATQLATVQAANEAMTRELHDHAVTAEQTATVPAAETAAA